MTLDAAADIAAAIDDMYAAFVAGDRARFDGHLHPDVTTWETHLPGPLRTRAELDAYRDARDGAGRRPVMDTLTARDKRIDVWGEVGVARYVLVAEPHGARPAHQGHRRAPAHARPLADRPPSRRAAE
ncbi:DUF4440 domain-containing protein [Nonomuraea ferruginea]|uniref:DUF4440 domain-containing protein n=1 Tax=Nonomuraea ferruginea TaxID=46174 RepID=UPI003617E337